MGKCKFCGNDAGLFHTAHRECESRNIKGNKQLAARVEVGLEKQAQPTNQLCKKIWSFAKSCYIENYHTETLAMRGWEQAVRKATDSSDFRPSTEKYLRRFAEEFPLSSNRVARSPIWSKYLMGRNAETMRELYREETRRIEQAERKVILERNEAERKRKREQDEAERRNRKVHEAYIDDLRHGKLAEPNLPLEDTPFILQKTERLIWVFKDTDYQKEVTRNRYDSDTRTFSVQHHFHSIERGMLGATTKHLYFVGDRQRFRIRYDRIVAFKEYPDGVGLNRAALDATHQKFATGEGWFTYNLVSTLARIC